MRELYVRHARLDGRSVAVLRAVDEGDRVWAQDVDGFIYAAEILSLEGDKIVVRPRHLRTIDDVVAVFSNGGDAVASKRDVQRGVRDRR